MSATGILTMSGEQYRRAAGVSKSMLDYLAPPDFTPAHYRARFITGEIEQEESPAMRLGSLTHRVILEPDTLDGAFYVKPEDLSFATKEGKAWKAAHADRTIITADDSAAVKGMRDAVWRHPAAKRLLKGDTERSLFAEDADGTLRKGRLDVLTKGNVVPDLKTCLSIEPGRLERQILDCRYHVQMAYYCDICALLGMEKYVGILICVEKEPPFDVVCYEIEADILQLGRAEYRRDLATLRNCLAKDEWPGRSNEVQPIGLPAWHMKKIEQEATV